MSWQIYRLKSLLSAPNMVSWLHYLKLNFYEDKCFCDIYFLLEFSVREYITLSQRQIVCLGNSSSASEALELCESDY